jgi:hypothetical protein
MPKTLLINKLRQSLVERLREKGDAIFAKYGPHIGWNELLRLLKDREFVRYPCEIRFDNSPLLPGEFAHSLPKGPEPENGFILCVHPAYAAQPDRIAHLVLHQLGLVNYGELVAPEDAEIFGAHALGLSREVYYEALCDLAGQLGGRES